ncbi:ribonuclease H-like domain-containing protein, partial [Tanacetum coccineum]
MRLHVLLDSAKGILYLHTEANPSVFHCDIKTSNILIDSKLTSKVADFGLSRLAPLLDDYGVVLTMSEQLAYGSNFSEPESSSFVESSTSPFYSSSNVPGSDLSSGGNPIVPNERNLVLNQVSEMSSCAIKGKPLVLPWGRTPRLDSDMRVSEILGFPSISHVPVSGPKWAPCLARVRSNRVLADVSSLPRMFLGPRKVLLDSGSGTPQLSRLLVLPRRLCSFVSCITDIKSVLSQKNLDIFCKNFHIPDEVHPLLPSRNQTIHEMPTGKIGVYTRFFEFANFRLPLSTFLVDVLRYYRIHISQLSVIAAAKVSHFEILCRVHDCEPTVGLFRCFYVNSKNKGWMSFSKRPGHDAVCYTKPLDSLKGWNDHFFWVDAFACPASFSWHTGKSVSKDPFPKSTEFNAEHYASLVAYPAPFHKYPEPFLCLVGMSRYYTLDENTYPKFLYKNGEEMDLLTFIRTADPTKLRIDERQRSEDEPKLLDTTVGRVVPLLPVIPARGESELEDSMDRIFDEEGNDGQAEQGDSTSGGQGVGIQPVSEVAETNIEDVVLRRQEKQKSMIVDSDEPSHPAKKLRKDHGIPVGTFIAGKSMPAIQRLHAGAVQNAAVRVSPFLLCPLFVISSDSSHHSGTHIAETEADSLIRSSAPAMTTATTVTVTAGAATVVKETVAKPSLFATGSSSVVYVLRWNVTNGSRLDDNRDCRKMVDEFAPPKFFASVRGMKHDQLLPKAEATEAIRLRTEASKFEAAEKSLHDEIRSPKERNAALEKEKGELDVRVVDLAASVKVREQEAAALDAMVTTVK